MRRSIHRLIEEQSAVRPQARAVVCDGVALTFEQLDQRANQLAHQLVRRGVGPDTIVGVQLERSLDLVVAMLAVLKAGGAYLPLDPSYPADRLAFMLEDAGAKLVISELDHAALARESTAALTREVDPDNLAYIIYTSGSTGRPKGVLIPHDRVVRLMTATQPWFQFGANDTWTFFHSYAFDFSVWEIWGALIYGGSVVIVPEHVRRSPDDFLKLLAAEQVTVLNQIPSAFRHLVAAAQRTPTPLSLRTVIFGGEALDLSSLAPWFALYPKPRLVNMYGITETTVHVSYRVIEPTDRRGSPIGVAIPDLQIHLLDDQLRPTDHGEIYVGGAGLARGYHARPGLTAERFVPDPFSHGARLYKTGDLARRLPDGSFEYAGRNDSQVKIRGYRIETGEISAALQLHPGVREAAVVVRDDRLVAYVAGTIEGLRDHLATSLPSYMIPSTFVAVDRLPVTPSGKLDLAALPAPERPRTIVEPIGESERVMAELWSSLLGVSPIGRDDRFLELGGHSLLAASVVSRLANEHGVTLPVRLFLTSPTLAEAAAAFGAATREATRQQSFPPRPQIDRAVISTAQESIWVHEQIMQTVEHRTRGYIECPVVRLHGPVDPRFVERALNELAARHEIWRTSFVLEDEPVQLIGRSARIPLRLVDRSGAAEPRHELEQVAEALATPFTLSRAPLVRCALVKFSATDHALVFALHHLVTDAWSETLIAGELARLYGFLARGEPLPPHSEVRVQYGDFATWEGDPAREPERERAREYWRAQFARPPAPLQLGRAAGGAKPIRLQRALAGKALVAFCRRHQVSTSAALSAAFAELLARRAPGGRFVLGVATANRIAGTEHMPGCFSGSLPLVIDVGDRPSFTALARRVMVDLAESLPHAVLPLPEIARIAGVRGALVHAQVSTQLPAATFTAGAVELVPDYVPVNDAKFTLELVIQELAGDDFTLTWVADPTAFDAAGVAAFASAFEVGLAAGLSGREPPRTIHGLIEQQAALRPQARALVCDGVALTFEQLDQRANQLAHQLVRRGVGPDTIVGVQLERSLDLVVAMLAVLKAGGAYLPLDPSYPADRLAFMLEDTGAKLVISELDHAALARESTAALTREVDPDNLAYIIYTSGSTGRPKGVLIPHDRVVRLMTATEPWFQFGANDTWTFFHSYAFDFSVWEIWGALIYGGSVVIVPEHVRRSPDDFLKLLAAERVTILNQIPSAFRHLVAAAQRTPTPLSLRTVIFGGEALDLASLAPWFALYPKPRLVNMYGITETTVHVSYRVIEPADTGGSPIGVAIPDLQIHLLDDQLRPTDHGEIYVGGAGLARGYHARPGLTAERFVPDPFSHGARLYKTGDLARRLPDGSFDYLGRNDSQVKIRGYRIETGEISAALQLYPGVREAAVVARDLDGDKRLVAYVASEVSADDLRAHLAASLPRYMIPSVFVAVERLPVTPSGKIDHAALPAPGIAAVPAIAEPAQTEDEVAITSLLATLLRVARVGLRDDFFAIGGHSLLALRLVAKLRAAFEVEIDLGKFFKQPTAEWLVAELRRLRGHGASSIPRVARDGALPLSSAQERVWFVERMLAKDGPRPLNVSIAIAIHGPLDRLALERALTEVIARHEIWRTNFRLVQRNLAQVISLPFALPLAVVDQVGAEREHRLRELAREQAHPPFDLAKGRLVRANLVRFAADDHVLLLAVHHIIYDGASLGVVLRELAALYAGTALPPLAVQFADIAHWQRATIASPEEVAYWTARLADAPPCELPTDFPRPAELTYLGAHVDVAIPRALVAAIRAFSQREGVSLFVTLVAAFAVQLQARTGGDDLMIGTALSSRDRVELESSLGLLLNLVALRVDTSGSPTFRELVQRVRGVVGDAFAHQAVPFEQVVAAQKRKPTLERAPLFSVGLYLNNVTAPELPGGTTWDVSFPDTGTVLDELSLQFTETTADLFASFEYRSDLFTRETIVALEAELERILASAIEDPDRRLSVLRAPPQVAAPAAGTAPLDPAARIAKIFAELLEVPEVAIGDSFFDLGGHSLLAALAVERIAEDFAIELPLRSIFEHPTAAGLAALVAPDTPARAIANIFAELLGVAVDLDDDFFDLGGQSLLAALAIERIGEHFDTTLALRAIFEAPTARALAGRLTTAPVEVAPPAPHAGTEAPLSYPQQRLWFLHELDPASSAYHVPIVRRLRGPLQLEALRRALELVIHHHAALRTTFPARDGIPYQQVLAPERLELEVTPATEVALDGLVEDVSDRPFDLARRPPLRVALFRLADDDFTLVVAMHHIIADGRAVDIVWRDIAAAYGANVRGEPAQLPPTLAFTDYAIALRERVTGESGARDLAAWVEALADAPADSDLPYRSGRPLRSTAPPREIAIDLGTAPRELARQSGATLFVTCLAAARALLVRATGNADVCLGTPVSNRARKGLDDAVGMFVNTLVFRNPVPAGATFADLIARERDTVLSALDRQETPFDQIVTALGVDRSASNPLFQVAFAHLHAAAAATSLGLVTAEPREPKRSAAHFDLEIETWETADGRVTAHFLYKQDLFDPWVIEGLAAQLARLVDTALLEPARPLDRIALVAPELRALAPAAAVTVVEMFERQVDRAPDRVALVLGANSLTYRELDDRANAVAAALQVDREAIVGISLERSFELVAAILGVWKAGAAYVPIDPKLPAARRAELARCARTVITHTDLPPAPRARVAIDPDQLAYVIFTSGSTGAPKGVMVSHRALATELECSTATLGRLDETDAFLQLAPYTFDQSIHEIMWPLVSGARTVLVAEGDQRDPARLIEHIREQRVTVVDAVPTLYAALVTEPGFASLSTVRTFIAGGEALPPDLARVLARDVPVWNGYGPTEAAITVSYARVAADAPIVLGAAWAGTAFYVLDAALEPMGLGLPGELYIAGHQLARGYLGRADLTAERFVPDPFAPGRMYRTGDRVRRRPDGTLEFLGRADEQVKLRGFRIETGEIEAIARAVVAECAVVVAGTQLVAYVVGAADLRAHLAAHLPEYMVPTAYVTLPALPKTASGKLDRRALPAPDEPAEVTRAPRTDDEHAIAAIWCEVLELETINIDDDFFALGGHSLLATRVVARIKARFGVALTLQQVFDAPTVEGLAAVVATLAKPAPVQPAPRRAELELSFAQQRMWLVDRMFPGSTAYHMPAGRRIRGGLDAEALRRAFEALVARHEILRTVFVAPGGLPVQRVQAPPPWPLPIERVDEAELARISRADAETPFDLETGPLMRTRLLQLAPDDHVLLVTMHHIVSDGWSFDVLWRELAELYAGRALPALPLQYADVAAAQRATATGELERQLAYWKQHLADAPEEVALPHKAPRSAAATSSELVVALDRELVAATRAIAQRESATLFMALLAAFRTVIARTTGQEDVVIGTPVAHRDRAELEALIGLFVNTVVLRGAVDETASFAELVHRERELTLAAYAHQDAPFEMIVDDLGLERSATRTPIFQLWFVQENVPVHEIALAPALVEQPYSRGANASKFDLSVYVNESRGGAELAFVFNKDLIADGVVAGIAARLVRMLELATRAPDAPLAQLAFGDPGVDPTMPLAHPAYPAVLDLVAELARRDPEAPALRYHDRTSTRGELATATERIVTALRTLGISPGDRVALTGSPSPALYAAFLGILRSGACLVPLSSRLTSDNADRILEHVGARVIVNANGATRSSRLPVATVDDAGTLICAPLVASAPHDPNVNYIYFTSGTTGAQKAVIGNLDPLAHFIAWQSATFDTAISAQLTELGFDVFLRDTMFALASGRLMAIPPREPADLEIGELLRWLDREQVTAVHTVPSLARAWLAACPADVTLAALRYVFVVGEPLDAALVAQWRARFGPTEFINLYGTTETGPAKAWYRVADPPAPGIQPIGHALPDTQLLIMRDATHAAAIGEVGELVIRTPFSTLGYLDGNTGAFAPNPFRDDPSDIFYRTGDRARRRGDEVEILGRIDDQLKIRGQRVDPAGIAAALRSLPGVRDAVVVAASEARLVAYVVPPLGPELRDQLRALVPPYMVPAAFVFLEALPKKPNGKVDRAALPAPSWDGVVDTFVAPRGPEEEAIAAIWCEVLELPRVGVRDNFFALGGHSLLAVLVASRVRAMFGVELGIAKFFDAPTVAGMAAEVRRGIKITTAPIVKIPRDGVLPLSFAQQRMWFLHRLAPGSAAYQVPLERRLRGPLAAEALRRSIEDVVHRHEALRTVFPSHDGSPHQRIDPPSRWELPIDELGDQSLDELAHREAERPFDLATGPLLRTRLVRIAPDDHLLLVTLHHIVSDGWSMAVFWSELAAFYAEHTTGAPARVAPLAIQYVDFAAWQRTAVGDTLAAQLAYWTEKLGDAPAETALPILRPRPAVPSTRAGMVTLALGADVVAAIRSSGKKTNATRFVTLLAAFRAVLARTTDQSDLCIGTPIANRGSKEVEPLIGLLLNTLVLRTPVEPAMTFHELVRRERATALEAYAHQDVPFEMIVDALEIPRSLDRTPLFQVSFVHQNMPQPARALGELVDVPYTRTTLTSRFDLSVISFEHGSELAFELVYNAELFEHWQLEQLAQQFEALLRAALREPDRALAELSIFELDETWNHTPGEVVDSTLPAMFEAQVDRTPDATALELGEQRMTYRELDARANRIARALITRGAGAETIVGIALERSFDLVAAILATSKAGAAWVPLDPHLPAARLDHIRAVAAPKLVIDADFVAADEATRPLVAIDPEQLAYVLFTSGSTGEPKGAMISHRGIVNELTSAQALRLALDTNDVFLQLAPYTFDLSVHEILWPLTTGARLVLVPEGDQRDPHRIVAAIRAHGVTILHPVPAVLRALLDDPDFERCTSLRMVVSGGEKMPLDVMRAFAAGRPELPLVNSYGPTETSVTVSQWLTRGDAGAVAIGLPWLATQLHVLDDRLRPVPLGVAGELYIGGRQVGRGYAARPGLTAERFVPDPFSPGARLYRTGDRARRWRDGNIELIGRLDGQVKLRGFRIELGEIEAALRRVPGVRETLVVVRDDRLVGYVVAEPWSNETARRFLAERLPEYMVPRSYVQLAAMPLNRSGKLDRNALPTDDAPANTFEPPHGPLEETLAGMWTELLGVERIGRRDNFFDLGGHSLLAARLAWEAKVSIAVVFAAPTIADLARAIEAERTTAPPPLTTVPRTGEPLLSYAQQRMWFLHQLAPASSAYHIALGRRLRGPLDIAVLEHAFAQLIDRHEILRTSFPAPRGVPYQQVHAPGPWSLPVLAGDLDAIARDHAERPFDLARGPLIRVALVAVAPGDHALLVTLHHIIADGWSVEILWRELDQLYAGHALRPLEHQYLDHAAWQRAWLSGDVLEHQLAYWKQRLAGAPEQTELPLAGTRPPIQTSHGASTSLRLEHLEQLRALAQRNGCTLFITLLAAFRALLSRYTGQDDLCIGAPIANRGMRDVDGLIGLFVNTLVLRTQAPRSTTFTELLALERTTALEAFAHGDTPFEMIVEALGVTRTLSRNPLVQVMFQVQFSDDGPGFGDSIDRELISTHVDLDVAALVDDRGIELRFVYNRDLFAAGMIDDLAWQFRALVHAALAEPDRAIGELPILTPAEREQLLHTWNRTARAMPARTLPELFDASVAASPDAIAVASRTGKVSYRELQARSHQIARHLRIAPEERVGLAIERGPNLVAAMLGVMKAGGAYLPIDPELPEDRRAFMLEDAGVRTVITDELVERALATESTAPPAIALSPEQLAYVLYTSGSTGRPKGVHIQHRSLVNFLEAMRDLVDNHATLLAVTTASFDISGLELYLPLLAGARTFIASRDEARDADRLRAVLAESGATVMQATPSTWRMLVDSGWNPPPGFVALCGGEALPPDLAAALVQRVELWNLYGPTETTIWSARKRITNSVRLGEPIANTRLYVLDPESLEPQPFEVAGELFIAGDGLARGYGNPDLTATRFVPDPFGGGRMYRTGDRVRRRRDGELEFLGRVDHQIKLRGFRIELGEIEAVLGEHPNVAEVVVVVRDELLVAYVVAFGTASIEALLATARARLPDYMVPSAVVFLDELPLSLAGKIDRKALPAPDRAARAGTEYVAPRSEAERIIAGIWSDALGIAEIGTRANFFELGGHSLLAVRVMWAIQRAFGVALPLDKLFSGPTIGELAANLAGARSLAPLVPTARTGELSYAQQRMWFLHQLAPSNPAYNIATGLRLRGALDVHALAQAIGDTVARHEALRTRFPSTRGVPRQDIQRPSEWVLPVEDVHAADLEQRSRDEANQPFELATDELLRTRLVRLAPDDHVLFATLHHIVADGWSLEPFWRDVRTFYLAHTRGGDLPPPLPIQYADYAAWQRAHLAVDHELAYWRTKLAGAPQELALPLRGPRPAIQTFRGGLVELELEPDLVVALRALARRESATLPMALLAGFRALLYRYTGQDDVCIGVPTANRAMPEVEQLVGLFVNTLVLRTTASPDLGFAELVARERTTALEAYAHQEAPFEMVIDALGVERTLDRNPLFQILFQVLFDDSGEPPWGDTTAEVVPRSRGTTHLDLDISAVVHRDSISLAFAFNADLFEPATIHDLARHFANLLRAATAAPERRLGSLPLLAPEETAMILDDWNATERTYDEPLVVAAIEAQVDRTPDAIAVTFEGAWLTYRELDARANQLAHHLISRGARHQPIAIRLERSFELVVAVLAVAKTGAPYLPIDPSYPEQRVRSILDDAACTTIVDLDTFARAATASTARPLVAIDPDDAAYIIFTSGSTGRPKGAVLAHAGLRNRLAWMQEAFALDATDAVLHKTPFTFDVSVWELFWAFTTGARLVVARPEGHRDPAYLAELIDAERVTTVHFVPSLLAPFLEVATAPSLRRVICSGEALSAALVRSFAAKLDCELHNLYGPTEATIDVSWWRCDSTVRSVVPIGRPIANTRLYVLDGELQPVPIGAPGELFISGVQLARGYRRRPDLTAERFIPDPFCAGQRMYRTGDVARYRRDGAIEFLGRVDHQVKIRGFRIELEEVEAVLRTHPQVRDVVAVARKRNGDDVLVAYVAGDAPQAELVELARERLPEFMVPTSFVTLRELPLTSSGKVDRKALPEPEWSALVRDFIAPRTAVEAALAGIWRSVLAVPQVGVRDNFFELGGHSLLAIRLLWEINRAFETKLPLAHMFSAPTIEQFATTPALAEKHVADHVELAPTQRTSCPATALQIANYDIYRDDPRNEFIHMALGLSFEGTLELGALERALTDLVARNSILRTTYHEVGGQIVQTVIPATPFALEVDELTHVPRDQRDDQQRAIIRALRGRTFDLSRDLPVRGALIVREPSHYVLVLIIHHTCGDGASLPTVSDEIARLYAHHIHHAPAPPPPVLQFIDFADHVERFTLSPAGRAQHAYWTRQLEGAPPVVLPIDHDRTAIDQLRDAAPRGMVCSPTHSVTATVPAAVRERLATLARETGGTTMMVLLAGFAATLRELTDQTDIAIQSTFSQRSQPGLERMIGVVANPVILRIDLSGEPSFTTLARRAQATVLGAFENGLVPLLDRVPHTLRRINFNYNLGLNVAEVAAPIAPGVRVTEFPVPLEEAKTPFDLHLWLFERSDGIFLRILGNERLFKRATLERLLRRFCELLDQAS